MNTVVETINATGRAFVSFSLPMLIQSGVLIVILLAVDAILRRKVRAVFRYWIWMLVLVKLVLPPSLGSPVSVGTWFGDTLEVPTASLFEPEAPQGAKSQVAESSPVGSAILSPPDPMISQSLMPPTSTAPVEAQPPVIPGTNAVVRSPAASLNWQGLTLLVWSAVVIALTLLLAQRAFFVRGLVGQAEEANPAMLSELEECRRRLGLQGRVGLRLSPNAAGPAVCGLLRPVILIPQTLAPRLHAHDLQAVLLHELAHVNRGDLWMNLAQTLLQIAYFYNPLLWLANAMIRRTREQAVDETVLVAMGESAQQYPETLVNIAKLAFTRRPILSLRLIGVVESTSALTARIKHILNRPLPKTAKLSLLGLIVVFIVAAVLLPMARAADGNASVDNKGPLDIHLVAVCPDGGDEFYDPRGKKLNIQLGMYEDYSGTWDSDEQRRDFILEVPDFDGQLLFLPVWVRSADGGVLGSGGAFLHRGKGPSPLIVCTTFQRTYRQRWFRLVTREASVDRVDLSLRYFHGTRGEAICTFTGPFAGGQVAQAEGGRPYQLTPESAYTLAESEIKFRVTTNQPFADDAPVLLYDKQGRRYRAERKDGTRGSRMYDAEAAPWDQIAAVTIGEKPHEITFRNIVVRYPNRPPRSYAAYWDPMAQRLGLGDASAEKVMRFRFQNARQAVDVLDAVRGPGPMGKVMEAIEFTLPPVDFASFDAATREKVRQAAARWLNSPDGEMRARGVELGLMAGFPEFVDPAFALLDAQGPTNDYQRRHIRAHVSTGLRRYRDNLTAADVERLKQRALRGDDPGIWRLFLDCLRASRRPVASDVLWELAQDDRPWVWWSCIHVLLAQGDERLKAYSSLPEKMKLRLFLASANTLAPGDDTVAARAKALVPALLTRETIHMGGLWLECRQAVVKHLSPQEATVVYMRFLQELSQPGARWRFEREHGRQNVLYTLVPRLVRDINLWYGVNLGGLGVYEPGKLGQDSAATPFANVLAQLITGTLSWYETGQETGVEVRSEPGEGREGRAEVVLPEADRRPITLDLATGEFVPLPPVGPEPQKVQQALRDLGKGDILYDVDLGDRTIILLRDAASEQVQEDTGEPGVKGHLINPQRLPEVLTVTTAEGRRYEVTILSAGEESCTLKYSPLPLDKGAGGGALVEPGKAEAATRAKLPDSSLVARLANGVTVELLAYSRLGQAGLEWWTPQGARTTIPGIYEADVEGHGSLVALRIEPAPEAGVFAWSFLPPDVRRELKPVWRVNGSNIWLVPLGEGRSYVNLELMAKVRDPAVAQAIARAGFSLPDAFEVAPWNMARITDVNRVDSDSTAFTAVVGQDGPFGPQDEPRVVAALDVAGQVHSLRRAQMSEYAAIHAGFTGWVRYETDVPVDRFAGIVAEGYSEREASMKLRNLSLRPGQPTQVRIEVAPQQQRPWWHRSEYDSQLESLGRALSDYAEENEGRYPPDLSAVRVYFEDTQWRWFQEHAVYLGAGKSSTQTDGVPLAYEKTLLPFGFGTYVLYSDDRVKFEVPQKLAELGIAAGSSKLPAESRSNGVGSAAGWQDIGQAIPPDANDMRTLAPGVVLDGIGQDVEGKVFVSSLRNVDATEERQYRFVLHRKDGQVLEPQYYLSLEQDGGKLWEKFTFDTWYHDREIDHFRLQSRRAERGQKLEIPTAQDEIAVMAATEEKPSRQKTLRPGVMRCPSMGGTIICLSRIPRACARRHP